MDLLATSKDGLRIEMMFDPRDPGLARFQRLPWELMRQPGTPEFIGLSRRRPIVRYLAVPLPAYTPHAVSPLRILAIASHLGNDTLPSLDLEREIRNLEEIVESSSNLEILRPETPTLAALRRTCFERECHVLHFMGHGGLVEGQTRHVLLFGAEDKGSESVRGADLVNKISDFPSVRLIVLNACRSASVADGTNFDVLAGIAHSLVLGGIPAVVAMQFPISDSAAIAFSRGFYLSLAAGEPVEAAVSEGRQAIHSEGPDSLEWGTPVLFIRGREQSSTKTSRRTLVLMSASVFLTLILATFLSTWGCRSYTKELVAQGVVLLERGKLPEALERFQKASKFAPGNAEVLSDIAAVEERLGDEKSAETHYREAVERHPDSGEHLFNLGHFLNGRGRFTDAYPVLSRSVDLEPERVDACGDLALAALRLGMLERARSALAVALRQAPERPVLYRLYGELEIQAGRPQEAIPPLKRARELYPHGDLGLSETSWLLSEAYRHLDDKASACRELYEFHRLDPSSITPWAPQAGTLATSLRCPSRGER
jgi:tetratricopeptide (TPR) repeat protein